VSQTGDPAQDSQGDDARRPTLNAAVRQRRADLAFYRRLRAAITQNQRALERLGR
jgi:hypothetical protein